MWPTAPRVWTFATSIDTHPVIPHFIPPPVFFHIPFLYLATTCNPSASLSLSHSDMPHTTPKSRATPTTPVRRRRNTRMVPKRPLHKASADRLLDRAWVLNRDCTTAPAVQDIIHFIVTKMTKDACVVAEYRRRKTLRRQDAQFVAQSGGKRIYTGHSPREN